MYTYTGSLKDAAAMTRSARTLGPWRSLVSVTHFYFIFARPFYTRHSFWYRISFFFFFSSFTSFILPPNPFRYYVSPLRSVEERIRFIRVFNGLSSFRSHSPLFVSFSAVDKRKCRRRNSNPFFFHRFFKALNHFLGRTQNLDYAKWKAAILTFSFFILLLFHSVGFYSPARKHNVISK